VLTFFNFRHAPIYRRQKCSYPTQTAHNVRLLWWHCITESDAWLNHMTSALEVVNNRQTLVKLRYVRMYNVYRLFCLELSCTLDVGGRVFTISCDSPRPLVLSLCRISKERVAGTPFCITHRRRSHNSRNGFISLLAIKTDENGNIQGCQKTGTLCFVRLNFTRY